MPAVRSTFAQATLVAALTAVMFAQGLDVSPPHLTHDEIKFAFQAKSIADSGRDINGRLLPLYFIEPGFSVGRDPLCIYVMAGVLTMLPLHEVSIRLSTVLVGSVGVGLMYLLAAGVFRSRLIAVFVAAVLALSPAYYIHSRLALSVLYPVPFTILWLIVLRAYLTDSRKALAYGTGAVLGIGVYSYLAAAIMMPLYLLATSLLLAQRRDRQGLRRVVAAFVIALVPLLLWQVVEPQRYANIVSAYRLFEPQPGTGPEAAPAEEPRVIARRIDTFWAAFNPGSLFLTGESSLQISTREVGSLLTPIAVFLVIGAITLRRRRDVLPRWLWVFGLLTAPIPGVVMADVEIRRWLNVLPFVAMFAGFGIERMMAAGRRQQLVAGALTVLCVLQFAFFTRDYFGPYRERASEWFGGNIRAGVLRVLADARLDEPSTVYISSDIPWVDAYWRFYTMVAQQRHLLERTHYLRLTQGELPPPAPGAVLIAPVPTPADRVTLAAAGWRDVQIVPDLDGTPSLAVVRPAP